MKKPSTTQVLNTFALRGELRKAALLTSDPDKALEIADAWCQIFASGLPRRDRGMFALQSEDVVGILLAAHNTDGDQSFAAIAADAAAGAAAFLGTPLRSAASAAARWDRTAAAASDIATSPQR